MSDTIEIHHYQQRTRSSSPLDIVTALIRALAFWLVIYISVIGLFVLWHYQTLPPPDAELVPIEQQQQHNVVIAESPQETLAKVLVIESEAELPGEVIIKTIEAPDVSEIDHLIKQINDVQKSKVSIQKSSDLLTKYRRRLEGNLRLEIPTLQSSYSKTSNKKDNVDKLKLQDLLKQDKLLEEDSIQEFVSDVDDVINELETLVTKKSTIDWAEVHKILNFEYPQKQSITDLAESNLCPESKASAVISYEEHEKLVASIEALRENIIENNERIANLATEEDHLDPLVAKTKHDVQELMTQLLDFLLKEDQQIKRSVDDSYEALQTIVDKDQDDELDYVNKLQEHENSKAKKELVIVDPNEDDEIEHQLALNEHVIDHINIGRVCVSEDDVITMLNEGLEAIYRSQDPRPVLIKYAARLDPELDSDNIILDAILDTSGGDESTQLSDDMSINLRKLLDNPFILESANWIDSLIDMIGGYNDYIDEFIDSLAPLIASLGEDSENDTNGYYSKFKRSQQDAVQKQELGKLVVEKILELTTQVDIPIPPNIPTTKAGLLL